jgi:hypothetical protein
MGGWMIWKDLRLQTRVAFEWNACGVVRVGCFTLVAFEDPSLTLGQKRRERDYGSVSPATHWAS